MAKMLKFELPDVSSRQWYQCLLWRLDFVQKRINYSFIPLGDCPALHVSVPYIQARNHGHIYVFNQPNLEYNYEKSNEHIFSPCISHIFSCIRLLGDGERKRRQAAKPKVFYVNTIECTSGYK